MNDDEWNVLKNVMSDFVYVKQLVSDLLKKEKEINGILSFLYGNAGVGGKLNLRQYDKKWETK